MHIKTFTVVAEFSTGKYISEVAGYTYPDAFTSAIDQISRDEIVRFMPMQSISITIKADKGVAALQGKIGC